MYQLSPTASFPLDAPRVLAQGATGTLLLSRSDVERLLSPDEFIAAVEDAFRQHALGKTPAPGILGLHAQDGSFHIKAALLTLDQPYFAAKTNANFPHNGVRHGLPTIQGVVVLCEAVRGLPLAVMDSMAITALRTAAAMAVATKYLAREKCDTALICGCGGQAPAQLRALLRVRIPARVYAYDQDAGITEQCCAIGDLHHAIAAGAMSRAEVYAELGEIVAGLKPARASDDEIIVFDSRGTALQDVAAAVAVYRRALEHGESARFSFNT